MVPVLVIEPVVPADVYPAVLIELGARVEEAIDEVLIIGTNVVDVEIVVPERYYRSISCSS